MNGRDLLEAMSYVEDSVIAESCSAPSIRWQRWASLAACLCLLAACTLPWSIPKKTESTATVQDSVVAETAAAAAQNDTPMAPASPAVSDEEYPASDQGGGIVFCALVQPESNTDGVITVTLLEIYRDDLPFTTGDQVVLIPADGCALPQGDGPWNVRIITWSETDGTITVDLVCE